MRALGFAAGRSAATGPTAHHQPASWQLDGLLAGFVKQPVAGEATVAGLCLDSRQCQPGDLFLALAGTRTHGLAFAQEAERRGACAVLFEPKLGLEIPSMAIPVLGLSQLGRHVSALAGRFYAHPSRDLVVIAVTGTDGKTSVSHFIAQALATLSMRYGLIGTLGWGFMGALNPSTHTTPDAVGLQAMLQALRAQGAAGVAMEASSHGLAQHRLDGVACTTAVLTNVTRDHLDYHADLAAYARAKRRLFELPGLRSAVLNLDDSFGRALFEALPKPLDRIGYTLAQAPVAPDMEVIGARALVASPQGLCFTVTSPWGEAVVESGLLGRFNVANLLAALGALISLGVPFETAAASLGRIKGVPGRMERFGGHGNPWAIVDYAHTPAALEQALKALRAHVAGRILCVFGCGGERDRGKRAPMAAAAEQFADQVFVTDDNPRHEPPQAIVADILRGFARPQAVTVCHDRVQAIEAALGQAGPHDVVLVAGKGHETVQITRHGPQPLSDRALLAHRLGAAA